MSTTPVDWLIVGVYLAFVLGIGFVLRARMDSSTEFLLAGRAMPSWVAAIAFISANLGAQEVIGMAASGAKYGMATSHFYWIGAIPAMLFLGVFMMPFYYGSRARSVPEYLRLRFDEKTRAFNALTFAFMTVVSSGISMYAMGALLHLLLGWSFDFSVLLSAGIVLVYISLGGLTSAIYNEVLQFVLIVFGFAPLAWLGVDAAGGWSGLELRLQGISIAHGFEPGAWSHIWRDLYTPSANPLGVEWFGLAMGLGFVLSFGYWCTDFLVVQRAMVANSMIAARRVPIIAAIPKMLFPFLVIVPGMVAVALAGNGAAGTLALPTKADGATNFDLAMPMMIAHFLPHGMLGLGLAALLASFMSGMAGNVTAFNTVWTYDIYQPYLRSGAPDRHYLQVGRLATVAGIALSIGAAYLADKFNNIMDLLQLLFAFVNAPLFGTFLLGMFWKRTTGHAAFIGLIAGTLAAALHHGLSLPMGSRPGVKGAWIGASIHYPSEMAQNLGTAIAAFAVCVMVTALISLVTTPRKESELAGLVYSLTHRERSAGPWYARPAGIAAAVLAAAVFLNWMFW